MSHSLGGSVVIFRTSGTDFPHLPELCVAGVILKASIDENIE